MKTFKKTFKFVCDKCRGFAHTETEYCEVCGTKTLRKATKEDYANYEIESTKDSKDSRMVFEKAQKTRKVKIRATRVAKKEADKAEKEVEKAEREAEKEVEKAKKEAEQP